MDPLNYQMNVQAPFNSALQGIQAGIGLSNAMDQSQARQMAMQRQQNMQATLAQIAQKPNPQAEDFSKATIQFPELAEHFKNTWGMLNQDQQQARLQQMTPVVAALNAGKNDVAQQLVQQYGQGYANSGNTQDAQHMNTLAQLIQQSPETAKTSANLSLAAFMGPDKYNETFKNMQTLPSTVASEQAKAQQAGYEAAYTPQRLALESGMKQSEMNNLDSQISNRAGVLGLDKDKLQSETELKLYEMQQKLNPALNLGSDAKSLINGSVVSSVASNQTANQMTDLANRLDTEGSGYGSFGTASEWLKAKTGNQDAMTSMRQEYTRLRSGATMKMLPPGAASDKDVSLAMAGFPPDNADTKQMAGFLRGMAKLNQYSAATESAKAEWVNSVGHLGKPRTDINIDGISVPAGATFPDFAKQYVARKAGQNTTAAEQQQIQGRSYMKYATPQAAPQIAPQVGQ